MKTTSTGRISQNLAGPIVTEDWRGQPQESHRYAAHLPVKELGKVETHIRIPGSRDWIKVKLSDFSSIGFGIIAKPGTFSNFTGSELEFRIEIGLGKLFQVWCTIQDRHAWKRGVKLCLRRQDVAAHYHVDTDRRSSERLSLEAGVSLQTSIKHPFLSGQWCGSKVSNINRNMGFSLISSDSTILVFEGMELDLFFEMPAFRSLPFRGLVTWVKALDETRIKFGVKCLDIPYKLHNALCDFLLLTHQWTPAQLRKRGFKVEQTGSRLIFRSVHTLDEYAQVLQLRRNSLTSAGHIDGDTPLESLAGAGDGHSRILSAYHGGMPVGTVAFSFPESEDTVLESEAYFPGQRYPFKIAPKPNIIEACRLHIHPEYKDADLLQGLFEKGAKFFLLSDREWLLASAVDDLWPMYRKIGFRRAGASYRRHFGNHNSHTNQLEQHLLFCHRTDLLLGRKINIFLWNTLFGDLIHHILERKLIQISPWERTVIRLKLLFKPLSKKLLDHRAARAFEKHMEMIRQGEA